MSNKSAALNRRGFLGLSACCFVSSFTFGCRQNRTPGHSEEHATERNLVNGGYIAPSAKPYIDISVRPTVVPLKQTSDQTCWAAAWTMLLSWRTNRHYAIREAVAQLGAAWLDNFDKNQGLKAQTFTEDQFLKASTLRAKPPANYLSSNYVELLATSGPLWINMGDGIMNHATVLVGAQNRSDGTIDFCFADPQKGKFVTLSDAKFFDEFEREARVIVQEKLRWDLRYQIFYW